MSGVGGYNGNPNLPKAGARHNLTTDQIVEFKKCMDDPVYFAENYFKIVHIDHGIVPFKLYPYQADAVKLAQSNRKLVINASRQSGKCVSINTLVKLRNRKSGEVMEITIGNFMKLRLKEVYGRSYEGTEEELIAAYISAFGRST